MAAFRTRIRVGIINVPFKVGRRAWRRCFGLMLRRADIFGVNEALTLRQRRLYRELAREKGLGFVGLTGPNPVFWDSAKYHLVSTRQVLIHPAGTSRRARIFRGYNAARWITEVVLEIIEHPGEEIAVLCTHWVPGGRRVPRWWRKDMRERSRNHVATLVEKHVGADRTVFTIGDFNIFRRFALGAVRWIRGRGVDKVGIAVPRHVEVDAKRAINFPAPTDHRHGTVGIVRLIVNPRSL